MSFRGGRGGSSSGRGNAPPAGYIPGLGRGASGFTTRSDVGGALPPAPASREGGIFGPAPANYVAGAGRGAGRMGESQGAGIGGSGGGGNEPLEGAAEEGQFYDADDDQADQIWAAIDERIQSRRKKRRRNEDDEGAGDTNNDDGDAQQTARARIGAQFRGLKEKLGQVTEDEWANLPDAIEDVRLRHKQRRGNMQETFTPLADSLLEQRSKSNMDVTSGAHTNRAATMTVEDGASTATASVVQNMSGLGAARGTVLGMSLDKVLSSDDHSGLKTEIDPQGYLTSLNASSMAAGAAHVVGDVDKARLLLKSVRDTNPQHGPGWIASARVEEAAGKILQARKIIQQGCQVCEDKEDVWLEAARLHPPAVAKTILATAVRRLPQSVKIFLKAADLEQNDIAAKKAVLRKGLEANPASVTLWKAAIELEDANDARILLSVAVDKIPHSVEMWLALAKLESYANAQKVLNKARKPLPAERAIWLAAAKLEESQNHADRVEMIVERAVQSLQRHEAIVTREQWLQEAEQAESAGAPLTSAALVQHTIGLGVEDEDRQRTWSEDVKGCLARGAVQTARAVLAHSLAVFPKKRSLWIQAVDLEKKHGTAESLDSMLEKASERLPRVEIFWLLRAKERWLASDVDKARDILAQAFEANPDSEAVWLAAAKLEWETGEIVRARLLLERARDRAPTARVFMKSALLEREQKNFDTCLKLVEEGLSRYPDYAKLYMMAGQICSDDLPQEKGNLDKARGYYQRGLDTCPESVVLWTLASRLEERASTFQNGGPSNSAAALAVGSTKARSLLELARLKNPKNADLWLEAVRLERRAGNPKLAETLMAKALQECPTSGLLLAENIFTAPRVEQKSKSAVAIKRSPDDPRVICAVASLFASERKADKARKWFDRAVILDPDLGDSWARYYAFELEHGSKESQSKVKERCVSAEPKHGELWASIMKDMSNRGKTVAEGLEMTAQKVQEQKAILAGSR